MNYQSLLTPRVLITAVVSLLVLKTCTNHDRAASNDDPGVANNNLEFDYALLQAESSLHGCWAAQTKLACDQYKEDKSKVINLASSEDENEDIENLLQQEINIGGLAVTQSLFGE